MTVPTREQDTIYLYLEKGTRDLRGSFSVHVRGVEVDLKRALNWVRPSGSGLLVEVRVGVLLSSSSSYDFSSSFISSRPNAIVALYGTMNGEPIRYLVRSPRVASLGDLPLLYSLINRDEDKKKEDQEEDEAVKDLDDPRAIFHHWKMEDWKRIESGEDFMLLSVKEDHFTDRARPATSSILLQYDRKYSLSTIDEPIPVSTLSTSTTTWASSAVSEVPHGERIRSIGGWSSLPYLLLRRLHCYLHNTTYFSHVCRRWRYLNHSMSYCPWIIYPTLVDSSTPPLYVSYPPSYIRFHPRK